jgi:hypothetical protein
MDDGPRQELRRIISTYGRSICHDPDWFAALLRAACPVHPHEVELIRKALDDRITSRLLALPDGMPWDAASSPLVRRLVNDLLLSEDEARWAVDSWGLALGKVTPQELAAAHPRELIGDAAAPTPGAKRSFWRWLTG